MFEGFLEPCHSATGSIVLPVKRHRGEPGHTRYYLDIGWKASTSTSRGRVLS